MDTEKTPRELWDRLDIESERAYRAFETYRNLPSGERTLIEAYRQHVGNPSAAKPSDTWSRWSNQFAWRERARAHDAHLDRIRERSIEKAIEEEAERQAREAERTRFNFNELLALSHERAMEWFEHAQPSDLRAQDVLGIIKVHMDAVKAFDVAREPTGEGDWEEDDAAIEQIITEVDALTDLEGPEDEERSGEGSGEDDSEESEDGHN